MTAGAFSVLLGEGAPLAEGVFSAAELYLEVTANGTTLAGRQRIVPVPQAHSTSSAFDLRVDGDPEVAGNVSVAGVVTGPLTVGDLTVTGAFNPASFTVLGPATHSIGTGIGCGQFNCTNVAGATDAKKIHELLGLAATCLRW